MLVTSPLEAVHQAWMATAVHGSETKPRGQRTWEVLHFHVTICQPAHALTEIPGRDLVPAIGMYEACQLVGQTSDPDYGAGRWSNMARFRNDGVFDGAYGLRIHGFLGRVVQELASDRASRRAVLSIYNAREDLTKDTLDVPCTLTVQFLLRRDALHMIVSMRSNDVWWGLPYDLTQFAALQVAVAQALDIEVGTYHHQVGSLHVYEQHRERAADLARGPHLGRAVPIRWGGSGAVWETSLRARAALSGSLLDPTTEWETHCVEALHG